MTARLLMIALDGADAASLDRWSDDGSLPHLAALRRSGSTVRLQAPAGTTDDSLWASFQYAEPEGEHGRYNYVMESREGRRAMAFLDEAARETFWHRLGARGIRSAIFDVPKTAAPKAFNGIHLADWLVHGRYFHAPRSYPESLAADVVHRFGQPPPSLCGYHRPAADDAAVSALVASLRGSLAQKRAAALHYLAAEPWDLFVVGFKEAHCAGHGLWHLADPTHPEFDAARSARLGWPVRQVFVDLDAAVGALVAAAGPDTAVIVFATTGMEPNGSLSHLMPTIVERLNAMVAEPPRGLRGVFRRLRARGLQAAGPRYEIMPHSDNCGALRIAGLSDRRERARSLHRVAGTLLGLADATTGESVVTSLTFPSAESRGSRVASLPDLLVHYRRGMVPDAVVSPVLGRIEARTERPRPGNHTMGGLAIVGAAVASADIGDLSTMQDFASFAARVLRRATSPRKATADTERAPVTTAR